MLFGKSWWVSDLVTQRSELDWVTAELRCEAVTADEPESVTLGTSEGDSRSCSVLNIMGLNGPNNGFLSHWAE